MTPEERHNIEVCLEDWRSARRGKTHYPGCERDHIGCAAWKLWEENERLRGRIEELEKGSK